MADQNRDQIEFVTEDLKDLDRQLGDGDIDEITAERLRDRYVAELDRLMSERPDLTEDDQHPEDGDAAASSPASTRRVSGRALVGTAIVVVAVAAIGAFTVKSLTGPSTAGVEGIVGSVVTGEGLVDLSAVTDEEMETVVADNPDVVGMRLALARRYFEAGEFDSALDHYMIILDQERNPEALANVGWMTYLSGRPDVALGYVEAALERQPDLITATWFLGNIQYALGNHVDASVALLVVVDADGVPDDVRQSAKDLLLEMAEG